ncbi:hypothetical protein [Sneathiella limimaris]|uniref:hypothetical protein n=1 Tax=Sneathiella limimaris TaxID=1964213 RepID=UPI00146CC954|nr:hypothetical protein [Sneathiella limimaris]
MSGIKSTSGSTPPTPVESNRPAGTSAQQITPVSPSNPAGGQSNPAVPQPNSISSLSEGSMLAAVVTARASGGDTMLHTEVGNFRMHSRSPIPVGSHVVLELEALDDMIVARVIAINGEKLAAPPSVSLLPVVNAPKQDAYALVNQLANQQGGSENQLQNLTAALNKAPARSPVAPNVPPAATQGQGQNPTNAATSFLIPGNTAQGQNTSALNSTLLAASLSAGNNTSPTPPSSAGPIAAYAHTKSPGYRSQPTTAQGPVGPQAATSPPASGTTPTGQQPVALGLELVRATIDNPSLNQRLITSLGMAPLSPGTKMSMVVLSPDAVPNAAPDLQKGIATGTVISLSGSLAGKGGARAVQVHVQSPELGLLRFVTTNPPANGSQIALAVSEKLEAFPLLASLGSSGLFKTPHLPLLSGWENLRLALNITASHDPDLANLLLNSRIPTASSGLGASLLFFLSALNGGNINKWLGQDFQNLMERSGHGDLMRNLQDDFATFSRLNSDQGGHDWKNFTFPFLIEGRLEQLKMFYRRHGRENDGQIEDETRFIIELDLSKSGPVQLDGLFRPKHFDLLFRHQKELETSLKDQVSQIFIENMEITGLTGSLTFRQLPTFPIHPTEEWEVRNPNLTQV